MHILTARCSWTCTTPHWIQDAPSTPSGSYFQKSRFHVPTIPSNSTIFLLMPRKSQTSLLDLSDSFTLQDPARWCMRSALQSLRFLWLWGWLLLTHVNSTHHRFSKSWLPASLMPSCIWNLSSSEVPVEFWPSAAGRHPGEVMWCKELPFWMVWLIASIWLSALNHPQLNSKITGERKSMNLLHHPWQSCP